MTPRSLRSSCVGDVIKLPQFYKRRLAMAQDNKKQDQNKDSGKKNPNQGGGSQDRNPGGGHGGNNR
jgi:hypothetical protein